MRDKGELHPRLRLSGVSDTNTDACTGSTLETAQISVYSQPQAESLHGPSCFGTTLSGARVPVQEEGKIHLKGTKPAQSQSSGLLLQQLGIRPHTEYGSDSHGAEDNFHLTTDSSSIPPISSPTSYQSDSYQYTLRKDITCVHIKSSSPTKAMVTNSLYGNAPT